MKTLLLTSFLVLLFQSSAQNLVPNPSFENYSSCPYTWTSLSYDSADNWECARNTPDYMHYCDTTNHMGVPMNFAGQQVPSSGQGYAGIIMYHLSQTQNEAVGVLLQQPLQIGVQYYVSFKVSLTTETVTHNCAINKIGARFSTQAYIYPNNVPIDNFAHIYTDSVILDETNWTEISGSFVADSAYTYLSIGNFFHYDSITVISVDPNSCSQTYYYLDDVCVSTNPEGCDFSIWNVGVNEIELSKKKTLVKIVDYFGRETEDKANTLLIYVYSDGTTEKVFRVE